jgi:hypothetical protein
MPPPNWRRRFADEVRFGYAGEPRLPADGRGYMYVDNPFPYGD